MAKNEDNALDPDALPEVGRYWKYRRRTSGTLLVLLGALVLLFVFRRPGVWGDGTIAGVVHDGALVVLFLGSILAFVWNGRMSERRGFLLGKFGRPPSAWPTPRRQPKPLPKPKAL
ncbi:MAG: hypothetical protein IT373_03330 [Polyangiaceae bacterium]|nr:hypothetical protein [Polyangiaceae bacterium]